MTNRGKDYQSACFVYKHQCFWYFQTKRHCFTQTNPKINGDFKGKECPCSEQLAGTHLFHLSFSNYWISARWLTKSAGRCTCLRYGRNVEVLPPKPQQQAAEWSQTKIAAFISSMTHLKRVQNWPTAHSWHPTKFPLSQHTAPGCHNLDASLVHPHILMFPFLHLCFHFSGCAMGALSCSKSDKKWGRKIKSGKFSAALWFKLLFVSCSLTLSTRSLCPQNRKHLDPTAHICLLIPSCSHFPDCLEPSHQI